jgi:hypothetical protein
MAGYDSTLYAGTDGEGFFRSGDNGRTWTESNDFGTAQTFVYAMVIDSTGTIFAMTNIGLLASRDRGSSWTTPSASYSDIAGGLAIDGLTLYAFGRPFNLARSTDGGKTWESIINGLNNVDDWVTGVAIHGTRWWLRNAAAASIAAPITERTGRRCRRRTEHALRSCRTAHFSPERTDPEFCAAPTMARHGSTRTSV